MPKTSKILIIGDSCMDSFSYCSADRLCPDLPVPVLIEREEVLNPGMAMNVKANLEALGSDCDIETNRQWTRVQKKRLVHKESNHTFLRIDSGAETIKRINFGKVLFSNYDIIGISDYDKGFLTYDDISYICSNHPLVFVDSKKKINECFANAFVIKINTPEYNASKQFIDSNPKIKSKVIKTAGSEGCYYNGKNFPVQQVEVRDLSGAGDTFFASLIHKYNQTKDLIESIKFSNTMASIVVQKKGVTTV